MWNWINEHKSIFRIKGLEKEMNIPGDTFRKGYSGKWKPEIYKYLKKLYNSLGEALKNYEQNNK